jgi:hypothetical protein
LILVLTGPATGASTVASRELILGGLVVEPSRILIIGGERRRPWVEWIQDQILAAARAWGPWTAAGAVGVEITDYH